MASIQLCQKCRGPRRAHGFAVKTAADTEVADTEVACLVFMTPWVINVLLAVLGYHCTYHVTLAMIPIFVQRHIYGIDLNKPQTRRDECGMLMRPYEGPIVPEAMGTIACTVYLVCMFIFIPFPFLHEFASWGAVTGGAWRVPAHHLDALPLAMPYSFPHAHLTKFLCALLAICCMCFLGFADNVLDLRWRERLWLPLVASLPLLVVYAVDGGGTLVIIPKLLAPLLGPSLQLGIAYYVFMAGLAIFCTNSINILAGGVNGRAGRTGDSLVYSFALCLGPRFSSRVCLAALSVAVNGLEVGQSVVIAGTVLVNNAIQLHRWPEGPLHDNNLFSIYLVVPFFGVSLALLEHNWYPSKAFVGDVSSTPPLVHLAPRWPAFQPCCVRVGFASDVLLLRGHDLRCRGHPRAQHKNASPLLSAAVRQFPLFAAAALQTDTVPTPPHACVHTTNGPLVQLVL